MTTMAEILKRHVATRTTRRSGQSLDRLGRLRTRAKETAKAAKAAADSYVTAAEFAYNTIHPNDSASANAYLRAEEASVRSVAKSKDAEIAAIALANASAAVRLSRHPLPRLSNSYIRSL